MPTLQGGWAGMIPFFSTSSCGCWTYDLPLLTNESTSLDAWTLARTNSVIHNQTDFPYTRDYYEVGGSTPLQLPGCNGYAATFEIFDIPRSVPEAMLAYFATYVTTTSPAPYSAVAGWAIWSWAGVFVEIGLTCFYYWPLGIVPPHYQFSTTWRMSYAGAGTPDFADVPYNYVIGTQDTMTGINHPIAGQYTITNAALAGAQVNFEYSTGVAAVNDVIGTFTFLRTDCPPLTTCESWIYNLPDATNRGHAYPLYGGTPQEWTYTTETSPVTYFPDYFKQIWYGSTIQRRDSYSYTSPPQVGSCANADISIVIKPIPASVFAAMADIVTGGTYNQQGVAGFGITTLWKLEWMGYACFIWAHCTSFRRDSPAGTGPYYGTPGASATPRTIRYTTAWDFTYPYEDPGSPSGISYGHTVGDTGYFYGDLTPQQHPLIGTYSIPRWTIGAGAGWDDTCYVESSAGIAQFDDVFGTMSTITTP